MGPWERIHFQCRRHSFNPWVGKIPWRRKWHLTPVFLPGKSNEERTLEGYSSWGYKRVGHNLETEQSNMRSSKETWKWKWSWRESSKQSRREILVPCPGIIWSHHVVANRWGNNGNSDRLFLGFKITADGDCSHDIKHLLLGRKVMTKLDSILKSRDIKMPTNVHLGKASFSSSHIWMWELDYKESWVPKNWCFWTMVLEKTLENNLDCKEIQPVHPKGNQS